MSVDRARRLLADPSGATALEFALVLPVFVAMVMLLFQFGWTQNTDSSLRFAVEQAGRALLLDPTLTQAQLQTMVRNRLVGSADSNVTVTMQQHGTGISRVAVLTGAYAHAIGVPGLATFPTNYTTNVTVPLPP